ncbi:hypothetical protein [Mycobacterium sp. HM-7]
MPATEPGPVGTCWAYDEHPGPTSSLPAEADPIAGIALDAELMLLVAGGGVDEDVLSLEHAVKAIAANTVTPAAANRG